MKLLRTLIFIMLSLNTGLSWANELAFTRPGLYMSFQYGGVYSSQVGDQITQYDEYSLLPTLGVDSMERFSLGYNLNQNIAFELALADTDVEQNQRSRDRTDAGVTIQSYDYDIYNLDALVVFKNSFTDLNTNIYFKTGLAYSYGEFGIFYKTTAGLDPSWNDFRQNFNQTFTANAFVPVFDVGGAWSASRYLSFTLDYQRTFKPIIGNGRFGDPLDTQLQPLNMVLIGALYHF